MQGAAAANNYVNLYQKRVQAIRYGELAPHMRYIQG